MIKRFKVLCMVVFALVVLTGTVSAYTGEEKEIQLIALDLNGTYETTADTVGEFFEEVGIELRSEDYVSTDLDKTLVQGDVIEVIYSFPVILSIDGAPRMVYTSKATVGEVLEEHKDDLGDNYRLDSLSESSSTKKQMTIEIITQKEVISTETIAVPYETEKVESDTITKGYEQLKQAGVDGQTQVTLKNLYEGTTLVSSTEIGNVTLSSPVKEIIEVGTKEAVKVQEYQAEIYLDDLVYTDVITVEATGYTQYDDGCDAITSTGTIVKRGVVAVDPSVFPYGTKFYIPGYGLGVAEDCGGAINGSKIDLCYDTIEEAFAWGRRKVEVYILE